MNVRLLRARGVAARAAVLLAAAALPATAQCPLQWAPSSGTDGAVLAFATMPDGDLVAGGTFTAIEGTPAAAIARRSGGVWAPLGGGIVGAVHALAVMPNGDVVAGGAFSSAGGVAASCIARWNGSSWAPLGSGVSGASLPWQPLGVHALQVRPNGDLVAAGHFHVAGGTTVEHIARWNGSVWSPLGGGMPSMHLNPVPVIRALAQLPDGDLVAAGQFPLAAGAALGNGASIARWNGSSWSMLGTGWPWFNTPELVRCLAVSPAGELLAAGAAADSYVLGSGWTSVPYVARWTGAAWVPVGAALQRTTGANHGSVHALAVLPDGDLLIGGNAAAANGGATNELLRGNGATWTAVGSAQGGDVHALQSPAGAALAVGGSFAAIGALASPRFAQLVTPCAPGIAVAGAGCASSTGAHALIALSPPWLGATFRAVATAMPPGSLGIAVTSLSPATITLSQVLPGGGAACDGLVFADLAQLALPFAGLAMTELPLPDVPAAAGWNLYHYVAALELGPAGNVVALTSTPRLALTLGSF